MQTVKYIYEGSDTRKLRLTGQQAESVAGDNNSTILSFDFPEMYDTYSKEILFDCYLESDILGKYKPRYLITGDIFQIPYELTANASKTNLKFNIQFTSEDYTTIELSQQSQIYISYSPVISPSDDSTYTNEVLQLTNKAHISTEYSEDAEEDRPVLTFTTLSGATQQVILNMPYLVDSLIPSRFIPGGVIVDEFFITDPSLLTTLTTASPPDFAIITAGAYEKNIYLCVGADPSQITSWMTIYSQVDFNKLATIQTGAQVNIIESISENGTPIEIINKNINIYVPTALSDLSDDSTHRLVTDTQISDWDNKQDQLTFDNTPTEDSTNPVTSNGIHDSLILKVDKEAGKELSTNDFTNDYKNKVDGIEANAEVNIIEVVKKNGVALVNTDKSVDVLVPTALSELSEDSTHRVVSDSEKSDWNSKQDALTFDSSPISESINPVTSGGVYTANQSKVDKVDGKGLSTNDFTDDFEIKLTNIATGAQVNVIESISKNSTPIEIIGKNVNIYVPTTLSDLSDDSTHRVVTDVQISSWNGKQSELTFDSTPVESSLNPVTSGGLYTSLDGKVDKVSGKELSANDFTDILKSKLDNIESEAQLNAVLELPLASIDYVDKVYQYIGATDVYTQFYFYACRESGGTYSWVLANPTASAVAWGAITGTLASQTDLQNALDGKQKYSVAGANITIERGETEDIFSAQLGDMPSGVIQYFYMDTSTTMGATKPTSDVSASISLVGTTAIQKDLFYTAPLASSYDTQTVMRYHTRLANLNIGTKYTWRPVLHAIYDSVDTIIAEIPLGQAVIFTAASTVYTATVTVPYALYTQYDALAGTQFNLAFRIVKDGADTQTINMETDIASNEYVYFSRSGGFISTDQVYQNDGGTILSQHTINSNVESALTGKASTSHASSDSTYGLGTTSNYGHCLVIDALTDSAYVDGKALSSHQGYVLSQVITGKQDIISAGTGLSFSGTTLNHLASITAGSIGSTTAIPAITYNASGHITNISEITVYPPTTVGTSGQYWSSDGSGTGIWQTLDTSPVSGNTVAITSGAVYTALSNKQNVITGAATTIVSSNLTTSKALVSDASGKVDVSAVTSTELGYVAGVTSAIQTQFTSKAPTSHASSATTYGVSSATDYGHAKASATTPAMDGTAGAGTETASFARGDHVHPSDTTKVDKVSGTSTFVKIYAKNTDGSQGSYDASSSATGGSGTLVFRAGAGDIRVNSTPPDANSATPKSYVDTALITKVTVQTINTDSSTASVTLTPVANNIYKYTVSGGLTSLTINTVPVSDSEIIIYFTSSTSFTFTDSSGCTWIDADPTFAVSKSYVVSFLNGIGVWGEAQ